MAKISWCEVYQPLAPEERLRLRDNINKADVVLLQPTASTGAASELQSVNVKAMLRPGAQCIVFPVVYHRGQLPGLVNLKRDGAGFKIPGIIYADATILRFLLKGLQDEDIAARLSASDLFEPDRIRAISEESFSVLHERERQAACDIFVTPFLRRNGDRQLFHTFNHPDRSVLTWIARQALDLAGIAAELPDQGQDVLRYPRFPVLPSVAAALGMPTPAEKSLRIEFQSRTMILADYVRYARRSIAAVDSEALIEALEQTPGADDIWSAMRPPRQDNRPSQRVAVWLRGWLRQR